MRQTKLVAAPAIWCLRSRDASRRVKTLNQTTLETTESLYSSDAEEEEEEEEEEDEEAQR
jgi:hypothetical protein